MFTRVLYILEVVIAGFLFHQKWRQKLHPADSQVQRRPESVVSLLEHHPAYLKFCSADRDRDQFPILGNGRWKSTSGTIHPKRFVFGEQWCTMRWFQMGFQVFPRNTGKNGIIERKPGNGFCPPTFEYRQPRRLKSGNASYSWAILGWIYRRWKVCRSRWV